MSNEGKSDTELIMLALEKFFPALFDYYQFIDFNEYKVEGSASALVRAVKSFAAAKVSHPIIALLYTARITNTHAVVA